MARTTGDNATAVANLFLKGLFSEKGIFHPELVGKHEKYFNQKKSPKKYFLGDF